MFKEFSSAFPQTFARLAELTIADDLEPDVWREKGAFQLSFADWLNTHEKQVVAAIWHEGTFDEVTVAFLLSSQAQT